MARKLLVIGLDSAPPELVFNKYRNHLPNLSNLMNNGSWEMLKSSIPPITIPAWTSMMTGKDPGQLGFYGFKNRTDYSYQELGFANSKAIKHKTIWDILSKNGKKSILIGVPQTYPPKPLNGYMVTCFLTPSIDNQYTFPSDFRYEVEKIVGKYIIDVDNFRTDDKKSLLQNIYKMTEVRMKLIKYLIKTKEWDFFFFVEMGIDRIQHGFWKYTDSTHPKYIPGNEFEDSLFNYYRYIDKEIGEILSLIDSNTAVMVVSDHGAKKMVGGICINEWLIKEGYLKLKSYPDKITSLEKVKIDWDRTTAWGAGGYYGRIFFNVIGREPNGKISRSDYQNVLNELSEKIAAIKDEKNAAIDNKIFSPKDIYQEVNGIPPDLIVYFGDLDWRSVGTIGHRSVHTFENDTGPDDANHDQCGIYIFKGLEEILQSDNPKLEITDIFSIILDYYKFK